MILTFLAVLSARMTTTVRFPKPRHVDASVNLRRRDTFVPEHFLNLAQVGAALKKMRRETVAQRVRADRRRRPDAERVFFDEFPKRFAAHSAAAAGNERERRVERANVATSAAFWRGGSVATVFFVKIGRGGERVRVETQFVDRPVRRRVEGKIGVRAASFDAVESIGGGEKEFRARPGDPIAERSNRAVAERNDPLFRAFAETTAGAAIDPNVVETESYDFRRATSRRVTKF